jgi:hypothetical protein
MSTAVSRSGKVCTITDEVCMHAKYLKLLSLATELKGNAEAFSYPPLWIKSTILFNQVENKIGKELQK